MQNYDAILDFWFKELEPKQRFAENAGVDATIARRFAGDRARRREQTKTEIADGAS